MFFIPRKLRKIDDVSSSFHEHFTLEYLLNENIQVIVLLGEPGSGKSFLLKYFHAEYPNTSAYFSLVNMEDEFNQDNLENKNLLLLDSIDEGLLETNSQEKFLTSLVKNLEKNKDKKIVITCRSLEWREIFETRLESLFGKDSVKKFDFLPLGDDEIILICSHFGLNDYASFKNFVTKHYLQGFLQNIFMLIGMIQLYAQDKLPNNSLEIYDQIIEKNFINYNDEPLEYTNEANEKESISPAKAKTAVRTLAIYMTLLHKVEIEKKEADTILSNFSSNEVKAILNTKLFDTKNTKTTFIHKSIQEFLSAQFLHDSQMPFRKIKQLLTNKGTFLEAYEEVMVFYSNFQTSYFDEILNIDPFILRRHPTLNEAQEVQLFTAIMNLLQQDKTRLWGNWSKLYHTTLVQFKSIEAIAKALSRHFLPSQLNDEQIDYLSHIVTNNDSVKIEEFLLKGLPDYSKEQEFPEQLITFYCKDRCVIKLFDLLEKQNAWKNISDDYLQIFIDRLYNLIDFKRLIPLFKTIKYPHRIDTTVSLFSYELVMQLFEAFQDKSNSRKYHEYPLACLQWFLEHYEECKRHNSNFLQWFFIEKLETLGYVYYHQPEPCFTELSQEFFDDIFALYFQPEFEKYHRILELLERFYTTEALQSISLPTLFQTYPLDSHLRAYRSLVNRLPLNEIALVTQHPTIQQWQKEAEKERIKTQKEYQKNMAKRQQYIDARQQKYQMWLKDIDTYWLAIFRTHNRDNFQKIRENLINDLQDNYPIFIQKLENEFKTYDLYLKIRNN
ncbi:NACHT domain-containing protein, partial [Sulfurospirillum cavolei]|uniref:NACHT domain-containing protein n=1 Tax=Sulfurospirillum cavolei TaxID=366522 RepID=UPI003FA28576